jgi:hypothetical protein
LVFGVASALLAGLWWLALTTKAKRLVADLGRCKTFVLEAGAAFQ